MENFYDIIIKSIGGGLSGQSEAIQCFSIIKNKKITFYNILHDIKHYKSLLYEYK